MGFRFRKTVRLNKFVRLNFTHTGMSLGLGPRGASVTIGKRGVRQTFSIPGTGISHQSFQPWGKSRALPAAPAPQQSIVLPPSAPKTKGRKVAICLAIGLLVVGVWGGMINKQTGPATPPVSAAGAAKFPEKVATPAPAKLPLSTAEVLEVQLLLKDLGFDPGGADGVIGPLTIAAVKRYEPSRGWPASGEIDIRLLQSLRASKASPAAKR